MFRKWLIALIPILVFAQVPVTVTTRAGKGTPLTFTEGDDNFLALQHAANAARQDWGRNDLTTTGLAWGYYGGQVWNGSAWTTIAAGTIALTPSATNYIERTEAGAVSVNTSGFTASKYPMAKVICGPAGTTSWTDQRAPLATVTPAGTGAVTRALTDKAKDQVNIKDFGAVAGGNTSDDAANKTTLATMISAQAALAGGTEPTRSMTVPFDVSYGLKRTDSTTWPDFSAWTTQNAILHDFSPGRDYTSPNSSGAQYRIWMHTPSPETRGTDGNTFWLRGNWAPAMMISNDSLLNDTDSANTYDNRRAHIYFATDGNVHWGIGMGTTSAQHKTVYQLGTFHVLSSGFPKVSPPQALGVLQNPFEISNEDGTFAFNGAIGTYAGYFGAKPGIQPTFVFDGETAIDINSPYATCSIATVDNGSGTGSPAGNTLTLNTTLGAISGSTPFAIGQYVIMQGLDEGVTITGGSGLVWTISGTAKALGNRAVTAGGTVIAGEPTVTLFNGYSTASNPYAKLILKNYGSPGFGIRLDGEVHGMVQSFFNTSDSSHQLVLSNLTAGAAPGSVNFYANGDRTSVSTGGGTSGGSYDQLKIFNSANNKSLNLTFKDATEFDMGVSGMGGTIKFTDNTASTSTSTGTITTTGGAGFGGSVFAFNYGLGGTGGSGYYELRPQGATPSTPASNYARLYADASGRPSWIRSDGFVRKFDSTLTADRTWTWQDSTGTIALSTNNLSFFSSTSSAQLATLLSDETGSGAAVFGTSPTLSGVALSDSITATAIAAPSTPASGKGVIYIDSTSKNIAAKNDAGTVNHGVQTNTGTSNQWVSAISDAGAVTTSQPAFSNLSGSVAASQMPAHTGDVTSSAGSVALTIAANAVTLADMAQVSTARVLGRTTAGTGNVESMTGTQTTALLDAMVGDSGSGGTKGLVPAPASGDAAAAKFLKADGTWAVPATSVLGIRPASMMWSNTNTVTISNTTASVFGTGGTGSTLTLPASFFQTGGHVQIRGWGIYSSGSATPTLAMTLSLGGSTICTLSANALSTSVSSKYFEFEGEFTLRTISGSAVVPASVSYKGFTATTTVNVGGSSQVSNSATTNAAGAVDLTMTTAAGTGTTTATLYQVAMMAY